MAPPARSRSLPPSAGPRPELATRVARFAALADPGRLRIADDLTLSDRTPSELHRRLGIPSNLLAHHLDVLERAGLVDRTRSSGDRRRRYVRIRRDALDGILPGRAVAPTAALFVCTANSARSQLAAALWRRLTAADATSAGTDPASAIHPGARSAARRAGLDLGDARPQSLASVAPAPLVVTVCDRAHEELPGDPRRLHWSVPDPVPDGREAAFDAVVADLRNRMTTLLAAGTP